MPSACGVEWSGTSSGKVDESEIPDAPEHKSHYLNAADTKGDSSFEVVDGDGNLRAGNVNSAWDLRNNGEGVSEECLRKLDDAFEDDVLPDSAYENSMTDTKTKSYTLQTEFSTLPTDAVTDGFNKYGVRENEDGSVDVRFTVMEPGVRKGARITPEFLQKVASYDYDRRPVQVDHSDSQLANVGYADPDKIKFSDGVLRVQVHIPDTGSDIRNDIIADFTHDPPQITDISVGFNPETVTVETSRNRDDEPKFTDARIQEFSLTPFPAGYDEGGLTPEFSEVSGCNCGGTPEEDPDPESFLEKKTHTLTQYKYD